jgi:hypothetical protein
MNDVISFLGKFTTQICRAQIAYTQYIGHGKIFLYARILKKINDELSELLVNKAHLLPSDLHHSALTLIHHLDVWRALWDDAYKSATPSISSVFVFRNDNSFPKGAVDDLIEYYMALRDSLNDGV